MLFMEFFISMSETIKYHDDDHKTLFLKTLSEQRLEGEFCDIAIVVEDVKFRAHSLDSSSVIEIDFLRSDIFEEVLNYMYTAKIFVKKEDVTLMTSSGQILGIRFLDKLCSQKRDSKSKYCLEINRPIGDAADPQDDDVEEIGDQDDSPSDDTEEGKWPTTTLRVQEAILKELGSEEVRKVNCCGQEVESMETPESEDLGSQTPQALTFNDGMSEVKDEQTPGWTTAASDMKFEYLLSGHHREQIACQACGKTFSDEGRLRKHEKPHTADRPFVCEMCTHQGLHHAGASEGAPEDPHGLQALQPRGVRQVGHPRPGCEEARAGAQQRAVLRLPHVRQGLQAQVPAQGPRAPSPRREALRVRLLHQGLRQGVRPEAAREQHAQRMQAGHPSAMQSETEQLQAAAMAAEAEQQLETTACS
ncbi:hypothetical protein FD755_001825 [Muntiacus reevesi]|uniref:C2H2-type domain-containing protein n=1 Tax=Muntiacus reevesi TaxID=9886 RepID=A0A5J5N5K9_MUNRE|nr:hypothetical protein FD755_001825 [Muntiacus reevesi]